MLVKMPLRVADNARMAFVNRVNSVNLSTNFKNPAANTSARVLCPVSNRNAQGPQWLSYSLGKCTGEQQFTRFTCSLSWAPFC